MPLLLQDLWSTYFLDWRIKIKNHLQQYHVTLRSYVFCDLVATMKNIFPLQRGLRLFVREVVFNKKIISTKLHKPLIMWTRWSHDKEKDVVFPFPRGLWPPNLTEWWLVIWSHKLQSHVSF